MEKEGQTMTWQDEVEEYIKSWVIKNYKQFPLEIAVCHLCNKLYEHLLSEEQIRTEIRRVISGQPKVELNEYIEIEDDRTLLRKILGQKIRR